MSCNSILQEIYNIRAEILAEHKGDLAAYVRSANERAKASGHLVAKLKQRSIQRKGSAGTVQLDAGEQQPTTTPANP